MPYYRAKWDVEQLVKSSGIDHVIFRPSFIFGPDGGIIPTFRRLVKLAPVTPIIGSGERRIQPIWVDDMAAYFVKALDLDAATNRTFEVGGPEPITWNEFWARFRRALGVRRRPTIHVPVGLMRVNALLTERLPGDIPLTRDLLTMLEHEDNVVTNDEAVQTFQLPLVPSTSNCAASPDAEPQIVAAGGLGEDDEAGRLLAFVLGPTGKERPRVCLVPTASAEEPEYIVNFYENLSGSCARWLRLVTALAPTASSPAPRRRSSRGSSKKSRGRSSKETAPSPVTSVVLVEAIPAGC